MSKRNLAFRIIGGVLAVGVLAWFAYANSGESVDVDLLIFTLHDLSVAMVIYCAVIVGMLITLGVGLRTDLRARRRPSSPERAGLETEGRSGAGPTTRAPDTEVGGKTSG